MPSQRAYTTPLFQPMPTGLILSPYPSPLGILELKNSPQILELRRRIEYHLALIQDLILATQAQGYICLRFDLVIAKFQSILKELSVELNDLAEAGAPLLIPLFAKLAIEVQYLAHLGGKLSFCKFKIN